MYMSSLMLSLNLSKQLLALENLQDMLFHICIAALPIWPPMKYEQHTIAQLTLVLLLGIF